MSSEILANRLKTSDIHPASLNSPYLPHLPPSPLVAYDKTILFERVPRIRRQGQAYISELLQC